MRFRKISAIIALFIFVLAIFAGCGNKTNKNKDVKRIAIIQYVQHPALDAAREGFISKLKEAGYEDGKNIELKYENASGEVATAGTIANTFANDKFDLILAIATPAAQAVAQKIKETPILITAVTDPEYAGLVKSNTDVQTNVSGTSDMSPVADQMEMIKKVVPNVRKVGIVYCSAEDNSKVLVKMAKEKLQKMGLESAEFTVQNSNDVQSVMESMVGKVDVIYAPTDNIISQSMSTVSAVTTKNKIPLIAGEEEQVKNGALCTKGINYKALGEQTADMAVKILTGEKKIQDMPIEYYKNTTLRVNYEVAKAIGIENIDELLK